MNTLRTIVPKDFIASLTPVERKIATLVAHGYTNREVVVRAHSSLRSVTLHLTNIYEKLNMDGSYNPRAALTRVVTLYEVGEWEQFTPP